MSHIQGLNASGSSDSQISPEIGGWQLFIKMRAYQQAGVIMGRLKQALQNDDILKSIYKVQHLVGVEYTGFVCGGLACFWTHPQAGLQVATVELVWFGTTEPDAMASSDSSSASTWLNQTVQIGSLSVQVWMLCLVGGVSLFLSSMCTGLWMGLIRGWSCSHSGRAVSLHILIQFVSLSHVLYHMYYVILHRLLLLLHSYVQDMAAETATACTAQR